jgi:hypothetical protein
VRTLRKLSPVFRSQKVILMVENKSEVQISRFLGAHFVGCEGFSRYPNTRSLLHDIVVKFCPVGNGKVRSRALEEPISDHYHHTN